MTLSLPFYLRRWLGVHWKLLKEISYTFSSFRILLERSRVASCSFDPFDTSISVLHSFQIRNMNYGRVSGELSVRLFVARSQFWKFWRKSTLPQPAAHFRHYEFAVRKILARQYCESLLHAAVRLENVTSSSSSSNRKNNKIADTRAARNPINQVTSGVN